MARLPRFLQVPPPSSQDRIPCNPRTPQPRPHTTKPRLPSLCSDHWSVFLTSPLPIRWESAVLFSFALQFYPERLSSLPCRGQMSLLQQLVLQKRWDWYRGQPVGRFECKHNIQVSHRLIAFRVSFLKTRVLALLLY